MVKGISLAGTGSCWITFEGKVAIDAGVQLKELVQADVICLTHAHMDHVGALLWAFTMRSMWKLPPQLVLGEEKLLQNIEELRQAMLKFGQQSLPWSPQVVKPGERVMIDRTRWIEGFRSVHVTPCMGWKGGVCRSKLKAEFQGKSANELVRIKQQGGVVVEDVCSPEWAITSDTMLDVFDLNPGLWKVPTLVVECTFVKPNQGAKAHEFGHIHAPALAAKLAEINFQGKLILTHFSSNATQEEREEALRLCKAEALPGCVPLLQ
jgi:ribonuclease Z